MKKTLSLLSECFLGTWHWSQDQLEITGLKKDIDHMPVTFFSTEK